VSVAVVGVEHHQMVSRSFALGMRLDARRTKPEGDDDQNR
jgi:hypothetical protein